MSDKIYVWDPLVRMFHWTLVLAFTIAYFTGEEESTLHVYSGYYILGLVGFRVLWGLVGTKYARFSHFNFSPTAVQDYLSRLISRKEGGKKYIGHNPAGSWMVIIMLVSIFITGYSGLELYATDGHGPLAQNVLEKTGIDSTEMNAMKADFIKVASNEREENEENESRKHESRERHEHEHENEDEEFWEELHEFSANFTVLLIFLHILGVTASSKKDGQNLVKAMITGYKR